jgi:MinD superfamily P-loop ATPase
MKVAVASGKGGTGKTTLATNLAAHLARSAPVVLVDLDVEEPNAGLFLSGSPVRDEVRCKPVPVWREDDCALCGSCREICRFGAIAMLPGRVMVLPELCHSCCACSELCPVGALPMEPRPMGRLRHQRSGRLDLVDSRLDVGEEQAVPLIRQTMQYVRDRFPYGATVILDAPPGTACPMVETVRHADLVVLVTEPTPFGLHDLKLAVATVRRLDRECVVVLNRDDARRPDGAGVESYCRTAGLPLIARIPHDRAIAEEYAAGRLTHDRVPGMTAAVEAVAGCLRERERARAS